MVAGEFMVDLVALVAISKGRRIGVATFVSVRPTTATNSQNGAPQSTNAWPLKTVVKLSHRAFQRGAVSPSKADDVRAHDKCSAAQLDHLPMLLTIADTIIVGYPRMANMWSLSREHSGDEHD